MHEMSPFFEKYPRIQENPYTMHQFYLGEFEYRKANTN